MHSTLFRSVATVVFLTCTFIASAQDAPRPDVQAVRLSTLPVLDGEVISDPAWQVLKPLTDFTQWVPTNGAPASQKTEFFIGYSDEYVHIAVICYEDNPDNIVVSSDGYQSDSATVVFDTFRNGQSGMAFGTNPIGAEYDASLNDEYADWNWSTTWQVKAKLIDEGWSAEFEIPFTSLRYGSDEVQTWGVNFARTMQKHNETSYWASVPTHFSMYRLSLAGTLSDIHVPKYQQNLTVTPYAIAGIVTQDSATSSSKDREQDFGFDLKYAITQSLTLDATYNTDFAQVESDQLQINLGRFGLFFPETRPFFLENAALFKMGMGGVRLFHSRNIGIEPDGRKLPITGGTRLTGKLGAAHNIGLLYMQAEAGEYVPQNDFLVGRYKRDLPNRSSYGALVAHRDGGGTSNLTLGVDGQWGIGERTDVSGFVAKTDTA